MTTPHTALVEALPPLPYACGEAVMDLCADHQGPIEAMQFLAEGTMLYTADQMRAYGEACARAALAQAEAAQPVAVPQGWKLRTYFDDDAAWLEISGPAGRCGLRASRWRSDGTDEGVSETIASRVLCKFGDALVAAPQPAEAAPKQGALTAAARQALTALEEIRPQNMGRLVHPAIVALREALQIDAAQPQQPAPEPAGWRLVPVEPTLHMTVAGGVALTDASCRDLEASIGELKACYSAMLAAAPQPPEAAA